MDSTSPSMSVAEPVDIRFVRHGQSVVLIHGLTAEGAAWLAENVGNGETQYFGNAYGAHGAGLLCDATLVRS